jgi:tRNA threonylcarbamoyladenosine modification (KEOPS) complex  Pcc1 subunit
MSGIDDGEELETVLSTMWPSELATAELLLRAVGIEYVVSDTAHFDQDDGAIEIRVRASDAAAARDVLEDLR